MKSLCCLAAALLFTWPAWAFETLRTSGGAEETRIEGVAGQVTERPLWTLERPGITQANFAIRGTLRCEGVVGQGYLQMWSFYPNGERYFSRTLAAQGPLQALSGDQARRGFTLPFFGQPGGPAPERLEVSLVLPDAGRVFVGPLELVQFAPDEDPATTAAGAWFSDAQAGMFGGLLGVLLGLLGTWIGWASTRGRARRWVFAALAAMALAGLACAIASLLAWLDGQAWVVTYPLGLGAVLCLGLSGGLVRVVRRRYERIELRRMRALDAP